MTKSNKTLLCCLLTCVMVLACALTILPIATPTTANAETTEKFVKVTEAPTDGDWSGTYLIVYEAGSVCFDGSLTNLDAASNNKGITITNGEVEATPTNKSYSFVFEKIADNVFSIKSSSGVYIGKTAKGNGIDVSTTKTYDNTISISSGKITIAGAVTYLKYNSDSGQNRFRYYGSGQKEISLFKLIAEAAHTHTWGEWTHVDGTETHTRKCTADATHTETAECTFNENNICTVCGYTKVICDHTELTLVPEVAATCTTTGVKEHYKCANVACGKLFDKNTADKQEVTPASLTIAALDHQWNDGEITTAATCTTDGVKTFTCTREGCGETKTETIPALGHNYGTDGKCTLCGAEKPAAKTYKLVTDVAQLKNGSKVIFIGKNGGNYVMANQKENNWGATAITIDNQSITMEEGTAYTEFLLTTNGLTYEISYTSDEKTMYIYAPTSDGKNYLKSQATNDENGKWLITIESGNAKLKSSGNNRTLDTILVVVCSPLILVVKMLFPFICLKNPKQQSNSPLPKP